MTQPSLLAAFPRLCLALALTASFCPHPGLRGQAPDTPPVRGYLSVEPFELRKEFVLRFDAIAERIGASGVIVIEATNRADLEGRIGDWLEGKCPVEVDGEPLAMERDRVHFVRPDPEKGLVVEDRETVPAAEALVGVVFAAALDGPPERVKVIWEVFPPDGSEAIVEAGARGQRAARKLTPGNAELVWENEAGLAVPELLKLPAPPEQAAFWQWKPFVWGCWVVVAATTIAGFFLRGQWRVWSIMLWFWAMAGGLAPVLSREEAIRVTPEEADEISYALLRNIYHAFDYRRESDIYDVLAASADGELLTKIYLEVRRSLQVESQGGARVRITDLDLRKCEVVSPWEAPGSFGAACEWVAVGTVTHWGHTHDRVNRYRATMTIGVRDDEWRLLDLELESEERIQE